MQQNNDVFNTIRQVEAVSDEYFNVVPLPTEIKPIINPIERELEAYSDMVGDRTQEEDETSQSSSISNNNSNKQETVIDEPDNIIDNSESRDAKITKNSTMVDSSSYVRIDLVESVKKEATDASDLSQANPIVKSNDNQNDSFNEKKSDIISGYKKISIDEDDVKDSVKENSLENKSPINNGIELSNPVIESSFDLNNNKSVVSPT